MKLLLKGGVLADGVRTAVSEEDELMERAAYLDYFARSYGWTWQQLQAQPQWVQQRLPIIGQILNEIEQERAQRST